MKLVFFILAVLAWSSMAADTLMAVKNLNLTKYSGIWYEIGRVPIIFEKECECTIANYTFNSSAGYVDVLNICNWGAPNGNLTKQAGKGYPADPVKGAVTTGKLQIQFFPGVPSTNYYVIDIDKNYKTALVGSPDKKNLWILARTPTISKQVYDKYLKKAVADGFDIKPFAKTYQGKGCPKY